MKIYILYTGGTIGSVGTPLAPMSGDKFAAAFKELINPMILNEYPGAEIVVESFSSTLDSTNMQPSEWVLMAERIAEKYQDYEDFLILHGTDTMAWTAAALSFMLPGISKTLTVTGSQLPIFSESSTTECGYQIRFNTDAVRNVLGAIRFFSMEVPEVCLYFADTFFRGNRVVKSNASDFVAFSSPNYSPLGLFGVLPTLFTQYVVPVAKSKSLSIEKNLEKVKKQLQVIKSNISNQSVLQIQTFPGYYNKSGTRSLLASMLKQLQDISPKLAGIVFESYGIGNIPNFPCMQEQIEKMHDEGIILLDCTQVFAGGVDYNEYAAGAWLKEKGVVSGHDMTPIAAMAKLTILLASYPEASQQEIEKMMGEDLAGELTSYYSLSGYQNGYLAPGESLFSPNGKYELENDDEGRIVLSCVSDEVPLELWSQGNGKAGRLVMQSSNDLVYYDEKKHITWHSDTPRIGFNSYLKVGNDGSLKLYNLDTDEPWETIYAGPDSDKRPKKVVRHPRKGRKVVGRHR